MKTLTLQRLAISLEAERRYHVASALLEADPDRQSWGRHQAYRDGAMLDAMHFELCAREAHSGRSAGEAQRADRYLQRLLEDFLDFCERDRTPAPEDSPPDPSCAAAQVGIVSPAMPIPDVERG